MKLTRFTACRGSGMSAANFGINDHDRWAGETRCPVCSGKVKLHRSRRYAESNDRGYTINRHLPRKPPAEKF